MSTFHKHQQQQNTIKFFLFSLLNSISEKKTYQCYLNRNFLLKRKVRQTLLLLYSTNPLYLPFSYFQSNFTPKIENGNITKKKKKNREVPLLHTLYNWVDRTHIIQSLNISCTTITTTFFLQRNLNSLGNLL
jgi:hypothetical protein